MGHKTLLQRGIALTHPRNPHFMHYTWKYLRAIGVQTILNLTVVAAATAGIFTFSGLVDLRHATAVYFICVLMATLRWSFVQGLVAAGASALAVAFFLHDPIFSLYVTNPSEVVELLIFAAAAVVIAYLAAELRGTRRERHDGSSQPTKADGATKLQRSATAPSPGDLAGRSGTVPARVREFLVRSPDAIYCDGCIQESLGLKWRQQVQLITATLAVTELFTRGAGECCVCKELKHVIRMVQADRSPPQLSLTAITSAR
jgi:Domain of unknown function (DUF4118)